MTAARSLALNLDDLIEAVRFAAFAMSTDAKTRPYLCGVRLDWEYAGLRVQATDGILMHVAALPRYGAPDDAERLFLLKAEDVAGLLGTFKTKRSRKDLVAVIDYAANFLSVQNAKSEALFAAYGWQPEDAELQLQAGARPKEHTACWLDFHRVVPKDPSPIFTAPAAAFVGFLDAVLGARGSAFKIETDPAASNKAILSGWTPCGNRYSRHGIEIRQEGVEDSEVCKPFVAGYQAIYLRRIVRAFGERSRLYLLAEDASCPSVWKAAVSTQSSRGPAWRVLRDRFALLMPCRA